ncbi:MAG: biotin/lipoyl-binding protein [Deltaproteobacteria bacterium]|nr:biotin/lipoyl-binding protein [Deltaproteobacteria bacterium]
MAYIATLGDQTHRIEIQELEEDHLYRVTIDGEELVIDGRKLSGHMYSLLVGDRSFTADVAVKDDNYTIICEGKSFRLKLLDERRTTRPGEGSSEGRKGDKEVRSFMPGKVVEVLVQVGDEVSKEQGVLIVEAMKMENEVRTSIAGKVKEIRVSPGQAVESGELLIVLE